MIYEKLARQRPDEAGDLLRKAADMRARGGARGRAAGDVAGDA